MDTIEVIALIGILITFLTTIIGWGFTYFMQHSILEKQNKIEQDSILLKEKFEFQRDQRQIIINEGLDFLKEIEEWFEMGRRLYFNSSSTSPIILPDFSETRFDEVPVDSLRKYREHIEKAKILSADLRDIRLLAPRLYYLAKIYDPNFLKEPQWDWGSTKMPKDLPQIIDNFENEVRDQFQEFTTGSETDRDFPKVENQFYSLHEAGIQAVERVKSNLLAGGEFA